MEKRLPVGISNFEEMITKNYYFVDKSLLIKELIDSGAAVTLIPRPRRFGKTLNLSMLKFFFEKTKKSNKYLFDNLAISKESECMKRQGRYPVIFLTFKDVKDTNWEDCYGNMIQIIAEEFARHEYLLKGDTLRPFEKSEFKKIINLIANKSSYSRSLRKLSFYLHRYYKKKPLILIDEYDAPINSGFINKYYNDITNFIRIFLSGGLKDNPDLEFSVLTGILKVAKESIFSGLNNLEVCSILSDFYDDKFGLLENEVEQVLCDYALNGKEIELIKSWYNGYSIGSRTIYNPWSIINFVKSKGKLQPYWINTSDNLIIQELIQNGSDELKEDLELLLSNKQVNKPIHENIVFQKIFVSTDVLWSFLLFSGYLTFTNYEVKDDGETCANLKIPNIEVKYFFQSTISNWFKDSLGIKNYNPLLKSLISGDIHKFEELFSDFVLNSFSYFDVTGNEPEKFYHAFVLGLLVDLNKTHHVKSNRESGHGRYDVMIIPKDKTKPGIIIEFKKVSKFRKETLEIAVQEGLKQIEEKGYEQELNDLGIKKVVKLAIAFDGKKVLIKELE